MKFAMTKIAAGLLLAVAATGAQAVAISRLNLTGATFCMDNPGSSGTTCMATGAGGSTGTATVTGVDSTYNLVGGYVGAGTFNGDANPASIIDMTFFGSAVNTYTHLDNQGALNSPAGSIAGGPVPNGTVDFGAGTIALDLSSWFANYHGTDFNQGSPTLTGSVIGAGPTGTFDVKWTSKIVGGSFNEFIGTWTLQGNVTAVPEASTYSMMLAGLGLVGAVARRRKLMA